MVKKDWVKLIVSLVLCQMAGFIGAIFSSSGVKTWFITLNKPYFNPPSWVFAPVWTVLYILMGISFFIIWKRSHSRSKVPAITFFIIQLILNSLWSFLFFGLNNIQFAFIEIIILWIFIIVCVITFYPISKTASIMLIPYLLWVSFALVLNYEIMRLNI